MSAETEAEAPEAPEAPATEQPAEQPAPAAPETPDQSAEMRRAWAALRRRQREVETRAKEAEAWAARQPKLAEAEKLLETDPLGALIALGVEPEALASRVLAGREGETDQIRKELEELRSWRKQQEQAAQEREAVSTLSALVPQYPSLSAYGERLGVGAEGVAREVLDVLVAEAERLGSAPDVDATLAALEERLARLIAPAAPPAATRPASAPRTGAAGIAGAPPAAEPAPATREERFAAALAAARRAGGG